MNDGFETAFGRLNGWKEIAAHVGKGVRTVQRWETLYGLPVRRIGREGGEIVFAFRDEIDRWMAEGGPRPSGAERAAEPDVPAAAPPPDPAPDAPIAPGRPRGPFARAGPLGAASALSAIILFAWTLWPNVGRPTRPDGREPARRPAAWRIDDERLVVFDGEGRFLFEHDFGFRTGGTLRSTDLSWAAPVQMADVDDDGRTEILVAAPAERRENRRLYCFEDDGRVRFVHQPGGLVHFGRTEYTEPWLAFRAFVTRGARGRKSIWAVFVHDLWFPTRLQEIGPDGTVRQEYWSNGYVEFVTEARWNGRPVVLVGGTNNELKAAALTILPREGVTGAAPAERRAYACGDCPPGRPQELVVFPTQCLLRSIAGQATVIDAWVEGGGRLRVAVLQHRGPPPEPLYSTVYYTLGPDLSVVSADLSPEFQATHRLLHARGVLDHALGARDDQALFPVRKWDGRRFADLPAAPVSH